MSRGLGAVQRAILEYLAQGVKRADVIAETVYQTDEPTNAQIVAVRRAIRTLEKKQLLECGEFSSATDKNDQSGDPVMGLHLYAWLPGNQPDIEPEVRFDSSVIQTLIIEFLARYGACRAHDLGRRTRRQLREAYGFDFYNYVPQYNRALHQLEKQERIRRFTNGYGEQMIESTTNLLSVAT